MARELLLTLRGYSSTTARRGCSLPGSANRKAPSDGVGCALFPSTPPAMERERNGGGAGGGISSGLVFFDGESLATLVLVRPPFNVIKKPRSLGCVLPFLLTTLAAGRTPLGMTIVSRIFMQA